MTKDTIKGIDGFIDELSDLGQSPLTPHGRDCVRTILLAFAAHVRHQDAAPTAPQPPAGEDGHVCVPNGYVLVRAASVSGEAETRCAGCGHRWSVPEGYLLHGVELCGDCWRKAQPVLHAPAVSGEAEPPRRMTAEELADCRKIGGSQVDFVNRCSLLLREIDTLTAERDAARMGLFSHLTGEHQLAEPTYRALKAEAGHWKHEAEMAREENAKLRKELDTEKGISDAAKDVINIAGNRFEKAEARIAALTDENAALKAENAIFARALGQQDSESLRKCLRALELLDRSQKPNTLPAAHSVVNETVAANSQPASGTAETIQLARRREEQP